MTNDFTIYSTGLIYLSVCTSLSDKKEIEDRANSLSPTGISSKWSVASERFRAGAENPHPCEMYPETHKHYLLSC